MDDFDFEDWWTGESFVESGIPVNIPDISVSNFDLGSLGEIDFRNLGGGFDLSDMGIDSLLNSIDLADAFNFGDLSGITGGIEGFGDVADIVGQGAAGIQGIEGFGDIADIVGQGAAGIQGIEGFGDVADIVGQGAAGIQGIEGFGDVAEQTESEIRSQLGDKMYEELYGPYAGLGYSEKDIEQLKEGTYAGREQTEDQVRQQLGDKLYEELYPMGIKNLSSSVYEGLGYTAKDIADLMTLNQAPIRETDWSGVIKTDKRGNITQIGDKKFGLQDDKKDSGGKGGGGGGKGGGGTGISKDNALLMALLGGLLGLLGRSGSNAPVGYKGSIPKYTATRVPGRGVEYTRAAGGGLMDLAVGGRPARYLRGGTDGMADKIKTDIDGKQPARLSHGEFVIPADIVSHLGNGNSDAGADVLYEMMSKVRKARTGTTKQGKQINPRNMIPA